MEEEWKAIAGYEQHYQISNQGKVRSKDRFIVCIDGKTSFRRGKLFKPKKHKAGYLFVQLSNKGKTKNHYIHRLVAIAFIENPEQKHLVNHMDGNKRNNRLENLEWVTSQGNALHAYRNNFLYKIGELKPKSKAVINTETGECFNSITDAAFTLKRNYTVVREMLSGRRIKKVPLEYYDILN